MSFAKFCVSARSARRALHGRRRRRRRRIQPRRDLRDLTARVAAKFLKELVLDDYSTAPLTAPAKSARRRSDWRAEHSDGGATGGGHGSGFDRQGCWQSWWNDRPQGRRSSGNSSRIPSAV